MLIGWPADSERVVYRALVTCALVCCTLLCASFVLFTLDQASKASKQQVSQLNASSGSGTPAHRRAGKPGAVRHFIDSSARTLTSPFRSLVSSSSRWTVEIFSTLVGLLIYGLGLGYLARYCRLA